MTRWEAVYCQAGHERSRQCGICSKGISIILHPLPEEAKAFTFDLGIPLLLSSVPRHPGLILFILGLLVNIGWILTYMEYNSEDRGFPSFRPPERAVIACMLKKSSQFISWLKALRRSLSLI